MVLSISRIVACSVCDKDEITRQTILPVGWGIPWDAHYTLCDTCIEKYETRFNEKLHFWEKGEVKEMRLL